MFDPGPEIPIPTSEPPRLMVVVDTEEEFDWSRPLARDNVAVTNIAAQARAHAVFDRYGLRPVYVIDYPAATDPAAVGPLRALVEADRCVIGAHLHPWVNPPHDEVVSAANSYAGNLPRALEAEKLARLTEAIEAGLGVRPTVYRAGRFGVGPNTAAILAELGYQIDLSVVPGTDFGRDGGPDFRRLGGRPYRFGPDGRLLEIPLSVGYVGLLAGLGPRLHRPLSARWAQRAHLPGILSRTRLLERIRLSPEGITLAEHKRLTAALLARGHRVFGLTYHSPSLAPGLGPYVRSEADLTRFLELIDAYCAHFFGALGGLPATPDDIAALAR